MLYHAVWLHYSIRELRATNGDMSTLAIDWHDTCNLIVNDNGNNMKLMSRKVTIAIRTLMDENHLLVVHMIDAVLQSNGFLELGPADSNSPSVGMDIAGTSCLKRTSG